MKNESQQKNEASTDTAAHDEYFIELEDFDFEVSEHDRKVAEQIDSADDEAAIPLNDISADIDDIFNFDDIEGSDWDFCDKSIPGADSNTETRLTENQSDTSLPLPNNSHLHVPSTIQINEMVESIDTQKGDVKQFLELARMAALCRVGKHELRASNASIKIEDIDLLTALIGNITIETAIAKHYSVIGHTLPYPEELMEYRTNTLGLISEINYEISNSGDLSDWKHAKQNKDDFDLDFCQCAPVVKLIMDWNASEHTMVVKESINLSTLSSNVNQECHESLFKRYVQKFHQALIETPNEFERHKYKKQLESEINQAIIKSSNNIKKGLDFCTNVSDSSKVKSVITIVGPSESGKKTLAESLFDASNLLFHTKVHLIEIDCAHYVHENCVSSFTGIDPFYRTPKQGFLTFEVEINPHAYIIFKNLNRAHDNLQRMVKDIIQNGFLTDTTTERRVSFENTQIVISLETQTENNKRGESLHVNSDGLALLKDKSLRLNGGLSSALGNYAIIKTERLDGIEAFELCQRKLAHASQGFSDQYKLSTYMSALIFMACGKNNLPSAIEHKISEIFDQIKEISFDAIIEHDLGNQANVAVKASLLPTQIAALGMKKKLRGTSELKIKHISAQQLEKKRSILDDFKILMIANEAKSQIKQLTTMPLSKEVTILFVGSLSELTSKEQQLIDAYVDTKVSENSQALCKAAMMHYAVKRVQYYKRRQFAVALSSSVHVEKENNETDVVTIEYLTLTERLSFDPEMLRHSFFNVIQPKERLHDVFGYHDVKEQIKQILHQMKDYQSSSTPPPKGLVFDGPPGTGKTLLALAMAGESELNVITANASDLMADGVENINILINAAESIAPAIVFIDEFDAIGRKRDGQSVGYSAIVNTLLTRMDGSSKPEAPVLFVAATNYKEELDPALLRAGRFEVSIKFSLPDMAERMTAIRQYAKQKAISVTASEAEMLAILFEGETYKSIENTIADCTQKCERRDKKKEVNLKDIIQHIYPSPELPIKYDPSFEHMMQIKAYRLAASIVAKQLVEPDTRAIYANVWHSCYFASSSQLEHYNYHNFRRDMVKLMAKRASEAIYLGDEKRCSAFTRKEREKINILANAAVSAINLSEADLHAELSYQQTTGNAESAFVRTAYKEVKTLLRANWAAVESLANMLLDKGDLSEKDFQRILSFNAVLK